jgi:hypothetical protein
VPPGKVKVDSELRRSETVSSQRIQQGFLSRSPHPPREVGGGGGGAIAAVPAEFGRGGEKREKKKTRSIRVCGTP